VLAAVGVGGWATAATPASARVPVASASLTGLVLVLVVAVVAMWQAREARRLRYRVAALDAQTARLTAQTSLLADDALPAVVRRLRDGTSIDVALADAPALADPAHQRILQTLAEEVGRGERMRAAAMAACANAAGRVQALATSMLADLREMENRHDEDVLGDLLRLDHSTAQAGRLADSIAVLTGARTGRRWTKPIVMESILRGAVGRINSYQRVRLHSTNTSAVAGYAAEGVMHALAELMDNATSFSPPSEEVHVYVEEVQAGVVVTVEDGGLVMGPAALLRAEHAVCADPLDLTTLSGTRLGLAVVGCLARKHGLTVSFRPSSRGGTGVVVLIPRQLISQPRPAAAAPSRAAGRQSRSAGVPAARARLDTVGLAAASGGPFGVGDGAFGAGDEASVEVGLAATLGETASPAASGELPPALPKRRRGQTLAVNTRLADSDQDQDQTPARSARSAAEAGARFGAFRQATRGPGREVGREVGRNAGEGVAAAGSAAGSAADSVADEGSR
jgi:signal transduction histidine kinase